MKTLTVWGLPLITALILGASAVHAASPSEVETATFAGGCFWCVESDFDKVEGVISTTSGYTGGDKKDPTYREVSAGGTGHTEAVQIVYDPTKVTYDQLLKVYWRNIDPTTSNRQFCDTGSQYRAEIFYHNERQKDLAEQSKRAVESTKSFEAPIVTRITMASEFYPAEEYHQDYHSKNPVRYKIYRYGCGRDKRLEQLWGSTG
jgi:peptide-methionine (S)-S-oxide reductase